MEVTGSLDVIGKNWLIGEDRDYLQIWCSQPEQEAPEATDNSMHPQSAEVVELHVP